MPENVSIAYRGANYAIGQAPRFYGIWHAAAPQSAPLEWWPLTPEGWTAAWARFASIEVPGTIAPVAGAYPAAASASAGPQLAAGATDPAATGPTGTAPASTAPASTAPDPQNPDPDYVDPQYGQVVERPAKPASTAGSSRLGAMLIAAGVVLGVIGLFPAYVDGSSLASASAELVPHLIYLVAWTAGAVLILLGGVRSQAGALLAAGVSAVTFGLFFADLGTPIADGSRFMGAGLVLSVIGWVVCAAGSGLACIAPVRALRERGTGRRTAGIRTARLAGHEIVPTVVLILAAIGAAIAFAPSWDSYLLRAASGASQKVTLGNAFANPGPVIFGDVAVMVLLVAAVVVAVLWRPIRLGAALVLGAIIPMLAQAVSAFVQVAQPTSPLQFGYSQSEANSIGLTISNGLTPMFWVYCAFLGTLILLCVWMLISIDSAADPAAAHPGYPYPGQPYSGQSYSGQPNATSSGAPADPAVAAHTVPPTAGGPGASLG